MKTYTFDDILAYFLGELDEREKAVFEARGLPHLYVAAALEGLEQLEKRFGSKTEMQKAIQQFHDAGKRCLFPGMPNPVESGPTRQDLEKKVSVEE